MTEEMILEKAQEFAESIPMDELFNELKRVTGIPDLKFTYKIGGSRTGMPHITFESQDLVDKVGFLKLIFADIRVSNFNSEIIYKNDQFMYWCTVDFHYNHPGGGSNGKTFYTARYVNNCWQFEIHN